MAGCRLPYACSLLLPCTQKAYAQASDAWLAAAEQLPVQVVALAAGNGMLYARTRRGYTYAWGCGSQGQLGVVSL